MMSHHTSVETISFFNFSPLLPTLIAHARLYICVGVEWMILLLFHYVKDTLNFGRGGWMLTGRHHFCHPMTHPVRNRIPCHHVHTLLGTFQVIKAPIHSSFIRDLILIQVASIRFYLLITHTLREKKKETEHRYLVPLSIWAPWSRYHPSHSNPSSIDWSTWYTLSKEKKKEKRKIWHSYVANMSMLVLPCSRVFFIQNRVFPCTLR